MVDKKTLSVKSSLNLEVKMTIILLWSLEPLSRNSWAAVLRALRRLPDFSGSSLFMKLVWFI